MPSMGSVVFRGQSGERYRFRVWPVGTQFKQLAGVCLVSRRSYENRTFGGAASHECQHIGQTADLSQLAYDSAWFSNANCVCVYLADNEAHRLFVEQDLLSSLGTWNTRLQANFEGAGGPAAPV